MTGLGLGRLAGRIARRFETARRSREYRALLAGLASGVTDPTRPRILAIGAWSFPLYSQSFVYQELAALVAAGFDVRVAHSSPGVAEALPPQCAALAERALRLPSERAITRRDLAHFRATRPVALARLLTRLAAESGRSERDLLADDHLLRAFSLARIAEAWRADFVHSYFFYEGSLAAYVVQQLLDLPRGVTCYADHLLADYPLKLAAPQLAAADLVVATSERARDELLTLAPACAPRLLVKPNSVDGSFFAMSTRREPESGEPFRLLSVARIDPKKGLLDLLAASLELRRRGVACVLDLVGGVEQGSEAGERELAALRAEIERRGLAGEVRLRGFLPAAGVREALRAAHLFVAPYVETSHGDKDGIPTALLEAMATGLAAVAARSGSISELIADGRNGRLVAPGAPLELAAAIGALLEAPGERRRLGAAAAATVRERFTVEVCEPALAGRIGALVARHRAATREDSGGGGGEAG
jgi:glycosyltransferase involved in cell wall biosynthesis